jgi:hypothetical protein
MCCIFERVYYCCCMQCATADEVINFLKKGIPCLVIMSLFAIYNAYVARTDSITELFVLKVIDAALYCFNSVSIIYFVSFPYECNICVPMTSAPLLWCFYVASIALQVVHNKLDGKKALANPGIALATDLISLVVLGSTIFILAMLRIKMSRGDTYKGASQNAQVDTRIRSKSAPAPRTSPRSGYSSGRTVQSARTMSV